jgi:hypothetical protein
MRIIHFKHVLLSRLNHYFKTKQKVMIMKKIIFSAALFVAAIGFANAQSEGTAKKCDKAKTEQCEKKCAKEGKKGCCKKDAAAKEGCCKKDVACKESKECSKKKCDKAAKQECKKAGEKKCCKKEAQEKK